MNNGARIAVGVIAALAAFCVWVFYSILIAAFGDRHLVFFVVYAQIGLTLAVVISYALRNPNRFAGVSPLGGALFAVIGLLIGSMYIGFQPGDGIGFALLCPTGEELIVFALTTALWYVSWLSFIKKTPDDLEQFFGPGSDCRQTFFIVLGVLASELAVLRLVTWPTL